MDKINNLTTEKQNQKTIKIDQVSTLEMVSLINQEDQKIASIVETQLPQIAKLVDAGVKAIKNGGRVIYFGAGTSGRLGILDASEMLPTYGESNWFIGLIAGGKKAIIEPVENIEDDEKIIIEQFTDIKANNQDIFIGIAASGRTPYVLSGLKYAKKIKAVTGSIATVEKALISQEATIAIEAATGPEAITGSTRMKSGTAQKMILNMLSTSIMIKLGKTYRNLMVDVKPTNAKLLARAIELIKKIANVDQKSAARQLKLAKYNVKIAIVMLIKKLDYVSALALLTNYNGHLGKIID